MCSRCRSLIAIAAACVFASAALAQTTRPGVLVVVAEPNNLPFSNDRLEGFENKLAELVAREMNAKLEYHWRALRRGYFRECIKSGEADVVMGVARDLDMALTTEPYYRSTYVFVRRQGSAAITSLDDPTLKRVRIGIPLTGESNPPPAIALGRRGIIENVVGFMVYGDYTQPDPPARIIEAVARGEVDVAIAWGPPAGYFARRHALSVTPVTPQLDEPALPMAFDISTGVAKRNQALRDQLNAIVKSRRAQIEAILDDYAIPRLPVTAAPHRADDDDDDEHAKGGGCG